MLTAILIIIIIGCLTAIIVILIKKFPQTLTINLESNVIKQAAVKQKLLEQRLERHFIEGGKKFLQFVNPFLEDLGRLFKKWYQKIVELEEYYRHKILKVSFKDKVVKEQQISELWQRAQQLVEQENYDEAEKKYIEIITFDNKNILAYKGLGELYLLKKDYEHAKEVYEFLLKITENDPLIYRELGEIAALKGDLKMAEADYLKSLEMDKGNIETYLSLAEIYLNLEEPQRAFAVVEQAKTLEPNNPRLLDFLIKISIIVHDKATALKAYRQLKEVNPENQKLPELREEIDKM